MKSEGEMASSVGNVADSTGNHDNNGRLARDNDDNRPLLLIFEDLFICHKFNNSVILTSLHACHD